MQQIQQTAASTGAADFNIPTNNIQVLLMMYDGAIGYLEKAVGYGKKGDLRQKNIYINKARDIIEEFNNSLDTESGGEIARCLRSLYFFMDRHLSKAHWEEGDEGVNEVVQMLHNLRDSWQYAAESLKEPSGSSAAVA